MDRRSFGSWGRRRADDRVFWREAVRADGPHNPMARPTVCSFRRVSSASSGDWISQNSDALDFDFDDVSGFHFSCASWGSGVDDVSGFQRHVLAYEAQDGGAIEDQVGGALVLDHFSVHARRELKISIVEIGYDRRS